MNEIYKHLLASEAKSLNMCNHIEPHMGNLTLVLPDSLQAKMRRHSEIRWSEVVRKSIAQKVEILDMMDSIAKKSKLTMKDVHEISHKIKAETFDELR